MFRLPDLRRLPNQKMPNAYYVPKIWSISELRHSYFSVDRYREISGNYLFIHHLEALKLDYCGSKDNFYRKLWKECTVPERKAWIQLSTDNLLLSQRWPHSVFVVGSDYMLVSRIALEFLENPHINHVFACFKKEYKNIELQEIAEKDARFQIYTVDFSSDNEIATIVKKVTKEVGTHGLNILVNVWEDSSSASCETDCAQFVSKLLPLLKAAAEHVAGDELSSYRASVINISALQPTDRGQVIAKKMTTMLEVCKASNIILTTIDAGAEMNNSDSDSRNIQKTDTIAIVVNNFYFLNSSHTGKIINQSLDIIS